MDIGGWVSVRRPPLTPELSLLSMLQCEPLPSSGRYISGQQLEHLLPLCNLEFSEGGTTSFVT